MTDPQPTDHGPDCPNTLVRMAAAHGVEIHTSGQPPPVPSPYGVQAFTCPHDVTYYIEPTANQVARWLENGTP